MDLKTSWPKLIFAGVVAVVPAVLSYCKASQEADYARVEADAGYKTLVQSVRHLEMVVTAQSNAIALLVGSGRGVAAEPLAAGSGAGSGSAAAGTAAGASADVPAPPDFRRLPDSTAAALRMQSKE